MEEGNSSLDWLHRFSASEWLAAAENELRKSTAALQAKQQRAGLAGARRAAGMACNAWLVGHTNERYGRSYMEHLKALSDDEIAPAEIQQAAKILLVTPLQAELVTLGPGDTRLANLAGEIVGYYQKLITNQS